MKQAGVLSLIIVAGSAARADSWDQPYDGVSTGFAAQNYADAPANSAYAFDEFVVPPGGSWLVQQIRAFGQETGVGAQTTATHFRVLVDHNISATAALSGDFSGSANLVGGDLVFNGFFGVLGPGTYWLTAWIDRPSSGGQWRWYQTTPVRGSQGYAQNPGGGLGFGTSPITLGSLPGASGPRDLAFSVSTVPEPSAFLGVGIGSILMLGLRRRSR